MRRWYSARNWACRSGVSGSRYGFSRWRAATARWPRRRPCGGGRCGAIHPRRLWRQQVVVLLRRQDARAMLVVVVGRRASSAAAVSRIKRCDGSSRLSGICTASTPPGAAPPAGAAAAARGHPPIATRHWHRPGPPARPANQLAMSPCSKLACGRRWRAVASMAASCRCDDARRWERATSSSVELPGPQPRSTTCRGAASGTRASNSAAGGAFVLEAAVQGRVPVAHRASSAKRSPGRRHGGEALPLAPCTGASSARASRRRRCGGSRQRLAAAPAACS